VVDIKGKVCFNDFEMFLEGMTGEKVDVVVSCDECSGFASGGRRGASYSRMRKLPVSWQKILFLKVKLTFTKTTYFLIKKDI
jgi:hypothetical protein